MDSYRAFKWLMVCTLNVLTLLTFQNCSDNFKVMNGEALFEHQNSVVSKEVYINGANDNTYFTGRDLTFTADLENIAANSTYDWSYLLNGSPQGCNRINSADQSVYKINCPVNMGNLVIKLMMRSPNGEMMPAEDVTYVLAVAPVGVPPASNDVTFAITLGTGKNSWNTVDNPIRAKVGQRVMITNNDTVAHRMHTGGKPCSHGANIQPGQTGVCVINSVFTGSVYDHNLGNSSKVYFETTN